MGKIIGIDLGTTNSVVSTIENGKAVILTNQEGAYTTPSVVAFSKKGEILVGQIAKRQAISNPENTIYSAKRFIGRLFDEVKDDLKNYPFQVVKKKDSTTCAFVINNEEVTPEKISSLVLSKLKKDAEATLGQEVSGAVITVPAYFNDSQRQATKDAAKVAGLKVERIINEPTAAALAYGLDKKENRRVAVYDFGGGTFDISILEINDQLVEVKATNGDTKLGGDDFDEVIVNWLAEEFLKTEGIDLRKDKMAFQRLREAAEKAKMDLSSTEETQINLPFITAGAEGPKHLDVSLTRSKFEQLTSDLVERTLEPCKVVLKDSEMSIDKIDEVIMVGGSTRIPAVQKKVRDFFKRDLNLSVNPDQVVASGAAVQAGVLSNEIKDILLLDVTPLSLGIETLGGVMTPLIKKNTTIPTRKSDVFSTAEDNQSIVSIHVLQGERGMAKDNKTLGRFDLSDIPPAPRGTPQIEVSFDIDSNGMINVSAKNKQTGKHQNIQIDKPSLNEEEIEQMVKSAQVYEEQDQKRKELVKLKNEVDGKIYQAEKLLKENKDKVSEDRKQALEKILSQARVDIASDKVEDKDFLTTLNEKITKELSEISQEIYKNTSSQKPGAEQAKKESPKQEGEDQTINADFEKKE